MTEQQMPLERLVAGWMADEAAGAPEPLLEQILTTTGRSRPRPRWWAMLTEAPMRSPRTRVAVGLPNRGLVYAALIALVLAGLAALAIGASILLNRPGPTDTADWSGFRGNADHAGIGLQGPTGNPVLDWQFHASGAVLEVAIVGDRVFFAADDGRLFAVSRDGGVTQWSVGVPNPPLVGPYAADGRLYVTDAKGLLYAFDQADGHRIWSTTTAYTVPSRMISADGTVYFGTGDGFLVAVDAATGIERWRLQPPGATLVNAPAFGNGLVYAGTVGAGYVAIDPASQRVVWRGDTSDDVTGTASVADGIAYIGAAATATSGKLRAFDAATGRLLWTATDDLLQLPTVADGVAYSSTIGGLAVAIDTATGTTKWRIHLAGEVRAPVVAGGIVYLFAGSERRVYAVEAATGDLLWRFDAPATGNCCIAVARGAVYVGLQDGSVIAIGGDRGTVLPQPFPSLAPSPAPTAPPSTGPSTTPVPSLAKVTWSTDLRQMGFAPVCQIAVDPTTGRIWAPEARSDKIAIFEPDGTFVEEWGGSGSGPGQFDFTRGNGDGYGTLAFAKDGSFFVLDVGNRRVQHFDARRTFLGEWGGFGTRPRQFTDPVGIAVAADGSVWVLDDIRSVVERYTPDGEVIGVFDPFTQQPINRGANSLAIDGHGNLYVSSVAPSEVFVFDPKGEFLRSVGSGQFYEQAGNMSIDAEGRLFVTQGPDRGSAPGILMFAPDGSLLGGFEPSGDGVDQLVFPGGIALDGKGGMYVEDSDPGSTRLIRLELQPLAVP
jgi:outer membrane protein assembly factor BamB